MVDEKQIKSIGQSLVKRSKDDYFGTSHLNESFFNDEPEFKENANSLIRNIGQYPHAFVLACLMDTGVDADTAWAIPYRVQQKVSSLLPYCDAMMIDDLCLEYLTERDVKEFVNYSTNFFAPKSRNVFNVFIEYLDEIEK